MRLSVVGVMACLSVVGLSAADPADAAIRKQMTIPAQPLAPALQQLARQRNIQFVYQSEIVGDRRTSGAVGELTFEEALTRLLAGTGLTYHYLQDNAITIVPLSDSPPPASEPGPRAVREQVRSSLDAVGSGTETGHRPAWRKFRLAQADTALRSDGSQPSAVAELTGLEEVIVTAQKREQSARDVPISITTFSAEQIESYGIDQVQDYFQLTPNVAFFTAGSSNDQRIAIRGVTNIGGYVNSLAMYVDEFNVTPGSSSSTYEQNLLDLERIEVLRGPQGIVFGRNVIGGAISLTTRKPTNELSANLTAEYGNFDTWSLRGTANVPVGEKLALRGTGYWRQSDGFIEDVGPAGSRNDYEGKGGRLAARFTPTDSLTVDLAVSRSNFDQGINDFVPSGVMFEELVFLGFPEPIDDGQGFYPNNLDKVATDSRVTSFNDTDMATARLAWDLGKFSVISVSGIIDNDTGYSGDADMTATSYYEDLIETGLRSYSTELRAQSNGSSGWGWLVGAFYSKDRNSRLFVRDLNDAFMQMLGLSGSRRVQDRLDIAEAESYALFGDLTWRDAAGRIAVSLGMRYTRDEEYNLYYNNSENIITGIPLSVSADGTETFTDLSPRLSLVYQLVPQLNAYATVSKGFKAGGFNFGVATIPGAPERFEKEVAWNYEVGLKGLFWDRRLRADLSAFYMKWEDIQVQDAFIDANRTPILLIQNAATAFSEGVELALQATPVRALNLELSAGYNNARFDEFTGALDLFGNEFDASGNPLPMAPRWSASAAAQYGLSFDSEHDAFMRVEYAYRGEFYNDPERIDAIGHFVESYDTWNLRIGVENDRYKIVAYAENLLNDDRYIGARSTQYLSGNAVVVSPRRIGVRVSFWFN